jgi:hypothetical protein
MRNAGIAAPSAMNSSRLKPLSKAKFAVELMIVKATKRQPTTSEAEDKRGAFCSIKSLNF